MPHSNVLCPFPWTLTVIFVLLTFPLLTSLSPFPRGKDWARSHVQKAVKMSFFISILPALLSLCNDKAIVTVYTSLSTNAFNFDLSLVLDTYSTVFTSVALLVTWSILEFALWYMHADPLKNRFFKLLLIFLMAMLLLVTANNMFQIFIAWEGVGIMSFLLISWWQARADANTAALQAVIYNRVGDIGLILALASIALTVHSWDLEQVFLAAKMAKMTFVPLGLVVAAAGKSAQFGLHPWLPAAMEGPTPVSALLHSSTMVVAGIFLLIRLSPLMQQSPAALTACLCLGSLTALYSATCALTQNDIKKIIAFSTSSQLGLMMVTIGLGQPHLAFVHVCGHAFFKSMLFLCSGIIIHCLNDEQDIRKMGGLQHVIPQTTFFVMLGSFALTGLPFLTGFYSKDAIIEAMNISTINACALGLTLLATSFTAIYSLRIIFFAPTGSPRFNPYPPINENVEDAMTPLYRLGRWSVYAGTVMAPAMINPQVQVMTMHPSLKMMALIITILGLILGAGVTMYAEKRMDPSPTLFYHHFSNMLGFFPNLMHRIAPKFMLTLAQTVANQMIDQTWLDKLEAKAITKYNLIMSKLLSEAQRGQLKVTLAIYIPTMVLAVTASMLWYR
uniref:NADH-ubiquinone oxidoreductase chain 5 n=1 Tax=Pelotretis flavilatus TaxID=526618 RepID=A0A0B4KIG9_9PLEU|nr:NADH dehydrogenase subunit 5 [Pelotretis flavilatus]AGI78921.1 NADH dehydrogenase subunit 5 [Pelotretis flavilatus]